MLKKRLVAVIIVRDGQVVQSVQFKHTNVIHYDAIHAIETFNRWSIDEIVLLNVSRSDDHFGNVSDKGKQQFLEIVDKVSETCFVPMTVGGWITDEAYASDLIQRGADKLVVNTIVEDDPELLTRLSNRFGKQCLVASIDFRKTDQGELVFVDRGARNTGQSPINWAIYAASLGAGEILLNCVEHDGKRKGYDCKVLKAICEAVNIPVIAFGGVFRWKHFVEGIDAGADAVAAANIFHYTEHSTKHAKRFMSDQGVLVRKEGLI